MTRNTVDSVIEIAEDDFNGLVITRGEALKIVRSIDKETKDGKTAAMVTLIKAKIEELIQRKTKIDK
ncbi:hypothetical protein KKF04_05805 [Patescibacteria group bacterium]|nr:hypothetical protein [Patescibacteria group bacterium]